MDVLAAIKDQIGLTADPLQDHGYLRLSYLHLIAPGETPQRQAEMARMSGCALVVAGIWRLLRIRHPLLDSPYVTGTAVERLWRIARAAQAIRPKAQVHRVAPGDVVRVVAPEHVFVVLAAVPLEEGLSVVGVDGGQVDASGHQCVQRISRTIDGTMERRNGLPARRVCDWIETAAVVERFGMS